MPAVLTIKMDAKPMVDALNAVVDNLPKELKIVSSKTAKKGKSFIAKAITRELAVKQKVVRDHLSVSAVGKTGASVNLEKSKRISLKEFKPKQNKSGVAYRISKSTGRQTALHAFSGPKPGQSSVKLRGHVYKRQGKSRLPIKKLQGPSPWGVLKKQAGMRNRVKRRLDAELTKQLAERIRFKTLKKQGVI